MTVSGKCPQMVQEFCFYQNELIYWQLIVAVLLRGAPQNMQEVSLGGKILFAFSLVNGEKDGLDQQSLRTGVCFGCSHGLLEWLLYSVRSAWALASIA